MLKSLLHSITAGPQCDRRKELCTRRRCESQGVPGIGRGCATGMCANKQGGECERVLTASLFNNI